MDGDLPMKTGVEPLVIEKDTRREKRVFPEGSTPYDLSHDGHQGDLNSPIHDLRVQWRD